MIAIRDHIIHATTLGASRHIALLLDPKHDLIPSCLKELIALKEFFTDLKVCLATKAQGSTFPQIPSLQNLTLLEQSFAQARTKDDRDEQVPASQRQALLGSMPIADQVQNPYLGIVQEFIAGTRSLSREDFASACSSLSRADSKKMHELIIEYKKIEGLRRALKDQKVDYGKISLNVSKEAKVQLAEIKSKQDSAALHAFLDQHEKKVGLNQEQLTQFINSIQHIELKSYKQILKKFAENGLAGIKKDDFDKAVQIVFSGNEASQKLWQMSYRMEVEKHINSLKRYQIILLTDLIQKIDQLKKELGPIFNGRRVDVNSNQLVAVACEMLYGFCLDNFKRIKKLLNSMYDYQDSTLYFVVYQHPLKKIEDLLKTGVLIRNDVFHFERLYREGIFSLDFLRELWFSYIQNLTYGVYYPSAITISSQGVAREALWSEPAVDELQRLKEAMEKDLKRDEDTLNMSAVLGISERQNQGASSSPASCSLISTAAAAAVVTGTTSGASSSSSSSAPTSQTSVAAATTALATGTGSSVSNALPSVASLSSSSSHFKAKSQEDGEAPANGSLPVLPSITPGSNPP